MSIINEALKKAQQKFKTSDPVQTPLQRDDIPQSIQEPLPVKPETRCIEKETEPLKNSQSDSPMEKPGLFSKPVVFLFFTICAMTVLCFSLFNKPLVNLPQTRIAPQLPLQKKASPASAKSPPQSPRPTIIQLSKTTLSVDGIMTSGEQRLVLINNTVYEEGEEVEGVRISKIEKDEIVLNDGGVEKVFKIKKR